MNSAQQNCIPCPKGIPPFTEKEALSRLSSVPGWELKDGGRRIERDFKFHNFREAWDFVGQVAELAEQQQHDPEIAFGWGYCNLAFLTDSINGLHDNDFIMAAKVNEIAHEPAIAGEMRN